MPRIRKPKTYIEYQFLELRFLGKIITFPDFIVMDDIDYDAIIGVEYVSDNKLVRPKAQYTGERGPLKYVPIQER